MVTSAVALRGLVRVKIADDADLAQARAAVRGRSYVLPDDVQLLTQPVLGHRIILQADARLRRRSVHDVLNEIVQSIPVPMFI